jgi:poly(A) polymerase
MLVARVCQLYPHAAPATLLQKFFMLFSKWFVFGASETLIRQLVSPREWPAPVLLKQMNDENKLGHRVWDPRVSSCSIMHIDLVLCRVAICILTSDWLDWFMLC